MPFDSAQGIRTAVRSVLIHVHERPCQCEVLGSTTVKTMSDSLMPSSAELIST